MVTSPSRGKKQSGGLDKTVIRIAVFGIVIVAAFTALFSRLWFLQVLASDQYRQLARENRVRRIQSEPPRGQILDRNGKVLVDNRSTFAVTVEREVLNDPRRRRRVFVPLSKLLDVKVADMRKRIQDVTISPYKPVAVVNHVPPEARDFILENQENFPGVDIEKLPVRHYTHGALAAHVLGYVGEISEDQLESAYFKNARPTYGPGDIVGKDGLELTYDRYLRGKPLIEKVVVNSSNDVILHKLKQLEGPGSDLVLFLDSRIQKLTEKSLAAGIHAARGAGYQAVGGAAVVMDPNTGGIVAMASQPEYDPMILADGLTEKEFDALGAKTPENPNDDALFNRAVQGQRAPGSSFKVVTAEAALATGVASPYTTLECDGASTYPPDNRPGAVTFSNWTSAYYGYINFSRSLEISCDTFYYELGWQLESAFGPPESAGGDGSERFQDLMRRAGFGHETGIDLPNEADGRVPDLKWCEENEDIGYCPDGWLPGYTINMAIGQGDLVVTPIQMAVTYSAIANGGRVLEPRLGMAIQKTDETSGEEKIIKEFHAPVAANLPLDDTELGVIREGLELVVSGDEGTANYAFSGFPLDRYPLAGKTGTAELGETDLNDAWFVSYAPVDDPQYVIAVYIERAGHGGESAAPVARQIWEGIFGIDRETDVQLGYDRSG